MVTVWRPTAMVLAVLAAAGCGSGHYPGFAPRTVGPVLTAPPITQAPGPRLPTSIVLPSGSLPASTGTGDAAATPGALPLGALPLGESLGTFLVTDADLPRSGIHLTAQPDSASVPRVELCAGHDPATAYTATATVGADIFTASGNGIEIVSAYPSGVAEQLMAAVTDAFGACARKAPITVGSATGTVSYTRVRLSVASSHPEVTAATRTVILGGASYESGLAYARFDDVVVLLQFDNVDAKTASGLLNRLLKAVVARHP